MRSRCLTHSSSRSCPDQQPPLTAPLLYALATFYKYSPVRTPPTGTALTWWGDLRVSETWRARLEGAPAPALPRFQGERASHASKVASERPD
ncbi:hypothetical protein Pcinc_015065 [Petrolisthes cinctipes]|uniref:Uncharacterized protein n=1 Tax=Petrolisthes cinctipes TaxID=88211 RepID=A0AAE1KQV2_PETCI|nr:hypothetical protein Pcinc_015065 [Petrolisthes cinctipes]